MSAFRFLIWGKRKKDFGMEAWRSFPILDRSPEPRDVMCAIRAGINWRSFKPLGNSVVPCDSVVKSDHLPQRHGDPQRFTEKIWASLSSTLNSWARRAAIRTVC